MRNSATDREMLTIDASKMRFCRCMVVAIGMMLGFPTIAEAHLVTTGLGPVYDGIGHLLLTPQDLIAVLALCLFAGLNGTAHCRKVLLLLPIVWLTAGLLSMTSFASSFEFPWSAISFIVLGLLVATNVKATPAWVALLSVLLGVVHGHDNGMALRENAGVLGLLGIVVALFVVISLAMAVVVSLDQPWMKLVIRVAGSWIVATGVMMLGWHFSPATNARTEKTVIVPVDLIGIDRPEIASHQLMGDVGEDRLLGEKQIENSSGNVTRLDVEVDLESPKPVDGQNVMESVVRGFAT